jgi:hypothetical protein
MPRHWVEFVNQNKKPENSIGQQKVRRSYEEGRRDAVEAASKGWAAEVATPIPSPSFAPIEMITPLVQNTVAQHLSLHKPTDNPPPTPVPIPTSETAQPKGTRASDRLSVLLQQFLQPLDPSGSTE